ncbi:uncharacterized protein PAC_20171 [Phialocephala subalpina]|uniref:Uncharacterized protein n=1 Tax=Phialocephala subalpina TaxID=576137 RepID=A0A1L7XZ54_9HELO|nr:uncharacterized protein PAC_20171 [Phialocephala subalpina]
MNTRNARSVRPGPEIVGQLSKGEGDPGALVSFPLRIDRTENVKPPLRPYERTWNTSELRNHLAKYQLYLDAMAARDTETRATQKAIQMKEYEEKPEARFFGF